MAQAVKILLPLIWMGFIFILSGMPADSFPAGATSAWQAIAHIFLYAVLSFLTLSAVQGRSNNGSRERSLFSDRKLIFFAVAFSIFYGITDEYHQGYVPGRFVSFGDLGLDAFGAVLGAIFFQFLNRGQKPKLLLHICCAGCGAYASESLKKNFDITLYFYNPNIFPESEYEKRLAETEKIAGRFNLNLIAGEYEHAIWLDKVKGRENDPERGERCRICYKDRLESAAKVARAKEFDFFATTLTVSPHKDARAISKIACCLSKTYGVKFLDKDFKKQGGFKKSVQLSKELGLYRQDYCGCEYSYKFTN